jgi:hypothetical protein
MCRSSTGRLTLPSQTEDSNHPSTLPPEELNPLMNPLLAQNMGRWAEVYFTSLPENRDQAVTDLLEELRAEAVAPENAAPIAAPTAVDVAAWQAADSAPPVLCPRCGYENRADHNFCGSCRAQLREEAGAFPPFDSEPAVPLGEMEQFQPAPSHPAPSQPAHSQPGRAEAQFIPADDAYDSFDYRETVAERSEMRTAQEQKPVRQNDVRQNDDRQENDLRNDNRPSEPRPSAGDQSDYSSFRFSSVPEAPRRSYRVYAGVVIAVVIAFLLYRAWSGGHAGAGTSPPQLPPASATDSAGPATAVPAPNSTASPASTAPASTPAPASAIRPKAETASHAARDEVPSSKPSGQTPAAATEAPALSANGAAELALAKSYLNGTDGKERNTTEAAALLWKAVSKQNAEATELLSDLYLKGDGVPKNCDQARVLLDAAASKGRKDAAERLGHLDAFDCQ